MATETTIVPALETTSSEGDTKVTYTEAQQAHLQTLIDAAVGRSSRQLRADLEVERTEKTRVAAELATEKATKAAVKTGTAEEQTQAARDEIERVKAGHQTALDAANAQIAARDREVIKAKSEAASVRTEVAIQNAASKVPFVDLGVVMKLTKDQVQLDPETGRFTVVNEAGQPKLNSSFEPMSLDEFYTDFAAKNKYLVRGNVIAGTGSTESSRSTLSTNGRFEVAEIFGPKSSSAKASELMKNDPAEYKRMRVIAKSAGLVV
jgi:hypothetical protein